MKVNIFHGSPSIIEKPVFGYGKPYNDYGLGFYCTYSLEMAKEFIKLGFHISLGGPVTFKNAKESKVIARVIPLDKLLVETDCPYLSPTPFRGKRNESAYVYYTALEIANLRGITLEEIDIATTTNAQNLFRI